MTSSSTGNFIYKGVTVVSLNQEVLNFARISGASLASVADSSDLDIIGYERFPRAISYAVRLSDVIFDKVAEEQVPNHAYFHQYRTANALLDQIGFKLGLFLQEKGYRVLQIAASQSVSHNGSGFQGLLSHRSVAIRAGLGWIGKSNNLITLEYGPRIRFGTLLTDAPLEVFSNTIDSQCGSCRLCVNACPAFALSGEAWVKGMARESIVDVRACSEHMHAAYQHIGRGVVCGICVSVCPKGTQRNRCDSTKR